MVTDDLKALQEGLGVHWRDRALLRQALVHRSYLNEYPGTPLQSNERLEFLGDAVIGYVVTRALYERFPDLAEGDLTGMRALLVRSETLGRIAGELGIGKYLYLGRGEEASGGRQRPLTLARALEAVVGALLVDQDLPAAAQFVLRLLEPDLAAFEAGKFEKDDKSRLQEFTQRHLQLTPVYRTVAAVGPDHAKHFTVEVVVGEEVVGRGFGRSKQDAEQEAARQALRAYGGEGGGQADPGAANP